MTLKMPHMGPAIAILSLSFAALAAFSAPAAETSPNSSARSRPVESIDPAPDIFEKAEKPDWNVKNSITRRTIRAAIPMSAVTCMNRLWAWGAFSMPGRV